MQTGCSGQPPNMLKHRAETPAFGESLEGLFRVLGFWGLGFRVWGLGFRFCGLGFRVVGVL